MKNKKIETKTSETQHIRGTRTQWTINVSKFPQKDGESDLDYRERIKIISEKK